MTVEQRSRIEEIEKDLTTFKSDADKRKYLLFALKNLIQDAIKTGDAYEGAMNPAYKYITTELRYLKAVKQPNE